MVHLHETGRNVTNKACMYEAFLPSKSHENDTQVMLKLAGMESGKKNVDPTPLSSCFHHIKFVEGVQSTSLDNGCT